MKAEDIAFWIIILILIGLAFWLFKGSPTTENAIISLIVFFVSSEMILWRKMFEIDKNTAVSFVRLKEEIKYMNNNLNEIKEIVKKKR